MIKSDYRADINGLRALAIVAVMIFHFFPSSLKGGFIGVDVFFVISGFLISGIIFRGIEQKSFSFRQFYLRRIRRILPALIIVITFCIVAGWFILLPNEYEQLGKHAAGGAAFISNFILAKEYGYFDAVSEYKILIHLWSLGIEEQFYIFWPLILFFCARRKMNLFTVIVSIAALSFFYNVLRVEYHPKSTFYHPFGRFWELLVGALLAHYNLYKHSIKTNSFFENIRSVCGLSLLVISFLQFDKFMLFPGWWALLPVAGCALIISAGPTAWVNKYILANRLCVFIGLISYPLYLWHWPLLSFARIMHMSPIGLTFKLGIISITVILAWMTYEFIEKPVRRSKNKKIHIPLIYMMIVILFIGSSAYIFHGYPNRFPESIQFLTNYKNIPLKSWRSEECFLEKNYNANKFSAICAGDKTKNSKKLFLWGDSHAAQYYPALIKYKNNFDVVQYTASTCPPVLDFIVTASPHCTKINSKIIKMIQNTKPNIVFLSAYWFGYNGKADLFNYLDLAELVKTIEQLKMTNVEKIILVGPSVEWDIALPTLLMRFSRNHNWSKPPERMYYGFNKDIINVDKEMEKLARGLSITYISPLKTLCNDKGCLTQSEGIPITLDNAHLTAEGATMVLDSNINKIIRPYYQKRTPDIGLVENK